MKTRFILFAFLFISTISFGQKSDAGILFGKVVSDGRPAIGVDVVNLVNEKAVRTNQNGEFRILAEPDHLLVISGPQYEYMRYSVDETDFSKQPVVISLMIKAIQLDETVVNAYSHINAVDLGILQKPAKVYTPAERKLYAAQTGPVDIVANLISGRAEMRRKEVEVERKEILMDRLKVLFEDADYFTNHLKIPSEQIEAFHFFAAEDAQLAPAVKSGNRDLVSFHLGRVAEEFLIRIADED